MLRSGRQVEVRIVTTGFFEDEDEDGVHTLSHGDSNQFRTLLSSLLGANSQQVQGPRTVAIVAQRG